jgi:hypothetical protein
VILYTYFRCWGWLRRLEVSGRSGSDAGRGRNPTPARGRVHLPRRGVLHSPVAWFKAILFTPPSTILNSRICIIITAWQKKTDRPSPWVVSQFLIYIEKYLKKNRDTSIYICLIRNLLNKTFVTYDSGIRLLTTKCFDETKYFMESLPFDDMYVYQCTFVNSKFVIFLADEDSRLNTKHLMSWCSELE